MNTSGSSSPRSTMARSQSFSTPIHIKTDLDAGPAHAYGKCLSSPDRDRLLLHPMNDFVIPSASTEDLSTSFEDLHIPSPLDAEVATVVHYRSRSQPVTDRVGVYRREDIDTEQKIGQGFYGEVFLVRIKLTNERVVMKKMKKISDANAEQRFLKEVALLRTLHHPNVLQYVGVLADYKQLPGQVHLLTEYIEGGTLAEWITDLSRTFEWHERVSVARDVAAGMAYLHSKGIIHRDLNSYNIFVRSEDPTPVAVVADLGLMQLWRGHGRRRRCTVVGAPYWMAPEMLRECTYDCRVDVFSYGIVLCELIGRVSADPDVMPRNGRDFGLDRVRFNAKYCKDCPGAFSRLTFLCASVDPNRRPSFDVVEEWLEYLLVDLLKEILRDHQRRMGVVSLAESGGSAPPSRKDSLVSSDPGRLIARIIQFEENVNTDSPLQSPSSGQSLNNSARYSFRVNSGSSSGESGIGGHIVTETNQDSFSSAKAETKTNINIQHESGIHTGVTTSSECLNL